MPKWISSGIPLRVFSWTPSGTPYKISLVLLRFLYELLPGFHQDFQEPFSNHFQGCCRNTYRDSSRSSHWDCTRILSGFPQGVLRRIFQGVLTGIPSFEDTIFWYIYIQKFFLGFLLISLLGFIPELLSFRFFFLILIRTCFWDSSWITTF